MTSGTCTRLIPVLRTCKTRARLALFIRRSKDGIYAQRASTRIPADLKIRTQAVENWNELWIENLPGITSMQEILRYANHYFIGWPWRFLLILVMKMNKWIICENKNSTIYYSRDILASNVFIYVDKHLVIRETNAKCFVTRQNEWISSENKAERKKIVLYWFLRV